MRNKNDNEGMFQEIKRTEVIFSDFIYSPYHKENLKVTIHKNKSNQQYIIETEGRTNNPNYEHRVEEIYKHTLAHQKDIVLSDLISSPYQEKRKADLLDKYNEMVNAQKTNPLSQLYRGEITIVNYKGEKVSITNRIIPKHWFLIDIAVNHQLVDWLQSKYLNKSLGKCFTIEGKIYLPGKREQIINHLTEELCKSHASTKSGLSKKEVFTLLNQMFVGFDHRGKTEQIITSLPNNILAKRFHSFYNHSQFYCKSIKAEDYTNILVKVFPQFDTTAEILAGNWGRS